MHTAYLCPTCPRPVADLVLVEQEEGHHGHGDVVEQGADQGTLHGCRSAKEVGDQNPSNGTSVPETKYKLQQSLSASPVPGLPSTSQVAG